MATIDQPETCDEVIREVRKTKARAAATVFVRAKTVGCVKRTICA
ncbi:MAG TPA: hypothetical protein VMY37_18040 [Thermoguttaceae bacterium]|nr:hypothetical protein [Thermoguttaceae bacterium]